MNDLIMFAIAASILLILMFGPILYHAIARSISDKFNVSFKGLLMIGATGFIGALFLVFNYVTS